VTAADEMVVSEESALEVFVFLLAAARIQLDEPAHYASMRLLAAAERLREGMKARSSAELRAFLEATEPLSEAAQEHLNDADAHGELLDEINALVGRFLAARD